LEQLINYCNCRRFINHCRHPVANRQPTTLTTQDIDQALTCCVKMVQQFLMHKEWRTWWKNERSLPPVLSRHCSHSSIRKVF
jgi:hypothetical protein